MTKVAIVGSAPITSVKWGPQIDACDVVIRFNNFSVEGYEEYVGSKTTVWVFGAIALGISVRPRYDYEQAWIIPRPCSKTLSAKIKQVQNELQRPSIVLPYSYITNLQNTLSAAASSGIIAIWHALQIFEPPLLCVGFGGFDAHGYLHYFEDRLIKNETIPHKGNNERQWLCQLRREGRIIPAITYV